MLMTADFSWEQVLKKALHLVLSSSLLLAENIDDKICNSQ